MKRFLMITIGAVIFIAAALATMGSVTPSSLKPAPQAIEIARASSSDTSSVSVALSAASLNSPPLSQGAYLNHSSTGYNGFLTIADLPLIRHKIGQVVGVKGFTADYRASWSERAPNIIYLRQGADELEIVYWFGKTPEEKSPPNFSQPGTPVFARGIVQNYRGRLQLKIEALENLSTKCLKPHSEKAANFSNPDSSQAVQSTTSLPPSIADQPPAVAWKPLSANEMERMRQGSELLLIYVRSEQIPRCRQVETDYILHPGFASCIGSRTVYFLDVTDSQAAILASRLGFYRAPALRLFHGGRFLKELVFAEKTTSQEVYEFLKSIPR